MTQPWARVPLGPEAARWRTGGTERLVLAVVHNVTSLTRLLDTLAAVEGDPRVQVLFTWTRSSPFTHDVERFLADIGALTIPWEQAVASEFDLAVSGSYGGELEQLKAPLLTVSHGVGYNKILARNQDPGIFGLSPDWLLHEGRLIPTSLILSHPEQLDRLARDCPQGLPAAVIAGDPCFDRMLAGVSHRARYRRSFGVLPRQKLVFVTSTWGPDSLFAQHAELLPRLLAELPLDDYRVVAALHPNVWHGHGPWQVRAWLAPSLRAGLTLLPPRDGWRAALVATDLVIGDHGSVTFYGAALDRPVLMPGFPHHAVDPSSPVGLLGAAAPALAADRPLLPQVRRALADHRAGRYSEITRSVTAAPGKATALLRAEMYRLMKLPETGPPPAVHRVPLPGPEAQAETVTTVLVAARREGDVLTVERFPAALGLNRPGFADGRHVCADESEPEQRLLELADIIHGPAATDHAAAVRWLDDTMANYPGCFVAAVPTGPHECLVQARGGRAVRCVTDQPALAASLVYDWLAQERGLETLPADQTVVAGPTRHRLRFVTGS
ncbi:hypothetical protein [Actinomadura hibisca]|uniref:hypothetical protein n=1 Tax=Actinomadura hibisca TaxID=68565 RepID=UPI00082F63C5|nr:hypothetical protein [Actinomadura hibisca]